MKDLHPSSQPLTDAELDELQDLLLGPEDDGDDDADLILGIDELHGFLTAVLCTPSMLMPSEYMPRVFGDREWQDFDEAGRAMGLLMQMYNAISDELRAGDFTPLLMERKLESGESAVISGDWCHGFVRGMSLRPHEWMIDDERFQKFMIPIMAMADTDPNSESTKWAHEHHDQLVEILPDTVMAIYGYMMDRREKPQPAKAAPKIGRNEPCSCGSGRKYKKCCGSGSSQLH